MRRLTEVKHFEILGDDGDVLTLYRSNKGEPFREGADLLLKNGYDTLGGVFLETDELRRLRDHLNELLGDK